MNIYTKLFLAIGLQNSTIETEHIVRYRINRTLHGSACQQEVLL